MTLRFDKLIAVGLVLGIGLGGFADGILFHQLFQFHNMLSARYPTVGLPAEELVVNLQINMFWDGLFHGLTWTATAIGLYGLWRVMQTPIPKSGNVLLGAMLLGWGIFNLVEGTLNHHVLQIHHVSETSNRLVWDLGFLAAGALLVIGGIGLIREGMRAARAAV